MSEHTRKKISASLKTKPASIKHSQYSKISFCVVCKDLIKHKHVRSCSTECKNELLSRGGRNSAAARINRSKDEIKLYNLIAAHFNKVTHNESIFNGWDADILIYDTKQAILWNGPWHYQEMNISNHSLKQVQTRDKIKLQEIISYGWTPVVFEDRLFTPESAFIFLLGTS